MNKVVLIGRLCADPEIRTTQSGKSVTNFRIAVNRDFKKDEADFFKITAWGKQAEVISRYFNKGGQIALTGRLQNSSYEKNGMKLTSTDVILESFDFVGGGKQKSNYSESKASTANNDSFFNDEDFNMLYESKDDDFPF